MTAVLDPEPLLRALHEAGVRHVIIGGFALNAHGAIRPSKERHVLDTDGLSIAEQIAALRDVERWLVA